MKISALLFLILFGTNSHTIFDFKSNSSINSWTTVDDTVMGGRSDSKFTLDSNGYGLFEGDISLKNYGGFCSVRHKFERMSVANFSKIRLKLKGDGKDYQLRIKDKTSNYYVYQHSFITSGEWQEIELKLSEFYPTFRGRNLDMPNFNKNHLEELGILIANKKEEKFRLLIDKIELLQ